MWKSMDINKEGKMNRLPRFLIILTSIIVVSCQPPSQEPEEKEALERTGTAQVKAYKVVPRKISDQLSYTGTIEPVRKMVITPEVGGKIAEIHVEEGDRVREGELLAELDTRSIKLQLEQAQAALEVAKANYRDAERNLQRMKRLRKEDAISEQQLEKVTLAYESAQAQLKQARAAVNMAQHNLDVSIMRAPFSGIIASKNAEEGDVINPMMGGFAPNSGVVTLMDFSTVKINIEVTQEDVVLIEKGQPAFLQVSAYSSRKFKGEVAVVNQAADPASKKFEVEIQISNSELLLRPNTFGKISLEIKSREDVLAVPQRALLENSYVFVVKNGVAEKRQVTIGLQSTEMMEIIEGLSEGEWVIVEGNYGLEDQAEVEITEVIQ